MSEGGFAVVWTATADGDLERALDFYRGRGARVAADWLGVLLERVGRLGDNPEIGAPVVLCRVATPHRRLRSGHHAVYYRVDTAASTVWIVRLWHTSKDPVGLVLG